MAASEAAPSIGMLAPDAASVAEAPDAATLDAALAAWLAPGRIDELKEAGTLA